MRPKITRRLPLLIMSVLLLGLAACSEGTGPKYPDPGEKQPKNDSLPSTG